MISVVDSSTSSPRHSTSHFEPALCVFLQYLTMNNKYRSIVLASQVSFSYLYLLESQVVRSRDLTRISANLLSH